VVRELNPPPQSEAGPAQTEKNSALPDGDSWALHAKFHKPIKLTSGYLFDQIFPRTRKFFAQTPSTERLPPFWAETVFGQVFGRGGMSKSQNPTVPPTRGSDVRLSCNATTVQLLITSCTV
jgi:hypothetical protein